eukprot:SAG22_NODE_1327_length_4730_cov_3.576549_4_plen_267_part_00
MTFIVRAPCPRSHSVLFRCLQGGLSYYSRWDVNTGPGFLAPELNKAASNTTVDNVAINLARLASRMTGDKLLAIETTNTAGIPAGPTDGSYHRSRAPPPPSILNASVSVKFTGNNGTVRILAFHHHPWFNATEVKAIQPGRIHVTVCGFAGWKARFQSPSNVPGVMWQLDDRHAQFWPTWEDDLMLANINTTVPGQFSWFQDGGGPWDQDEDTNAYKLWLARAAEYRKLAQLQTETAEDAFMNGGCLQVTATLAPHSVVLFEYRLS